MKIYQAKSSSYAADTKLHLKPSRGHNPKIQKRELSFLYATHFQDGFVITVKYRHHIPRGIQIMERTQNCI